MSATLLFLASAIAAGDAVVHIDLIAPRTQSITASQDWARRFAEEDVRVTVRPARPGEDFGVFEKSRGPLRFVTVVAELNSDGEVRLPDRTLRLGDGAGISNWVDGLKVYGAAGNPEGQPGWGLSAADWSALCRDAVRRGPPLVDPTLADVLKRLEETRSREVQIDGTVEVAKSEKCQTPPEDISVGVGTAISLRSVGLGLAPQRSPDGSIIWTVRPLGDESQAWPTGWAFTPDADRARALASLYKNTQLPRVRSLGEYVESIAEATKIPHVPLDADLKSFQPAWRDVDTSLLPVKGRPILVVNRVLRKNRVTTRLVWDDAGRAFILVRPSDGQPDPKPRDLRPPAVQAVDPYLPQD